MIQSMTGFGKATGIYENKKITIEIKSLNSKNLDIYVRMPPLYREKEIELRKYVGQLLDRGKIECNVNVEANGENKSFSINKDLASRYHSEISGLEKHLNISSGDMMSQILRMPDIFAVENDEINDEEWETVWKVLVEAVKKHQEFRNEEGSALFSEFTTRIGNIKAAFDQVPAYEKERIDDIRNRIETNLEDFVGGAKVDKNRFEQELIYYIEKIDIAEEKQRLGKHLDYFIEIMNEPISQGKKLGFISQEIGREINTLGSKAYHSEMQKLVVEMKDELEKIKEQVLNTL